MGTRLTPEAINMILCKAKFKQAPFSPAKSPKIPPMRKEK